MNVTIIGTGYVGLVTGTCLAEVGNRVMCVDTDSKKIEGLKAGRLPIYEPGLESMVHENLESGRITFSTSLKDGVDHGEILFIAVGTPPDEDGSADLSHVLAVASEIGKVMTDYRTVVTKSTVPVGTAAKVRACLESELSARGVAIPFSVVSNPEFLKEGAAVEDFMKPDRVVIGADDERGIAAMRQLYAPFNRQHDRMIVMDIASAELTKYAANAMLATKISFMNDMANLAERLGADIESVRQGIGSDPRIGYHFIYPGCGYGGSCFPKDVKALYRTGLENNYYSRILEAVESVNEDQKKVLLNKIYRHFSDNVKEKVFAIWGLAFKPNTDDMREAPSRVVIDDLLKHGARIRAFDPVAGEEARHIYGGQMGFELVNDPYSALDDADALVIVTEWKIFRSPDYSQIQKRMKQQVVFDGRNVFDPVTAKQHNIQYYGIGRQT